MATLPGDQWRRSGCDSACQCRVVSCCSILSGCWPEPGLVLGNESLNTSSLLLEAGLALVSRSSCIRCVSVPTSLCLSLPGPPQQMFGVLEEERPLVLLEVKCIILSLPNSFLRPYSFPSCQGSVCSHTYQLRIWPSSTFPAPYYFPSAF